MSHRCLQSKTEKGLLASALEIHIFFTLKPDLLASTAAATGPE